MAEVMVTTSEGMLEAVVSIVDVVDVTGAA
jgi:hypothetical protein